MTASRDATTASHRHAARHARRRPSMRARTMPIRAKRRSSEPWARGAIWHRATPGRPCKVFNDV
ncbi:hypothetical protein C5615_18345 [Burkholderia cepacia]|uniref:Uncharacterized protein n=1 Tax=Burkholderia cepacia TaxID=292 RepID=A0A2S8IQ11_BURCE|nr:hypothetical protein C5615_18345 [Burkholderia cepacia]